MSAHGSPTFAVETITPELARSYLSTSNGNRAISKGNVQFYARQMRDGKWTVCHQGIAFSVNGDLIDGHHRLNAIVHADVPVNMMVARGVSVASRQVIDQGKGRTAADIYRLGKSTAGIVTLAGFIIGLKRPQDLGPVANSELKNIGDRLIEHQCKTRAVMSSNGVKVAVCLLAYDTGNEGLFFDRYTWLTTQRYDMMTPAMQVFNRYAIGKKWVGSSASIELMARAIIGLDDRTKVQRITDTKLEEVREWTREVVRRAIGGAR